MVISLFFPKYLRFWKLKLKYFTIEYFFAKQINGIHFLIIIKLWAKFQLICGVLFDDHYPRFWGLKLDFFSVRNLSAVFSKIGRIYLLLSNYVQSCSKIREPFWISKLVGPAEGRAGHYKGASLLGIRKSKREYTNKWNTKMSSFKQLSFHG